MHNVQPLDTTALGKRFSRFGYAFVPLVTDELRLTCAIEVLLLRPSPVGSVIQSGDLDNRLKTIFDALRLPNDGTELGRYTGPGPDEAPFFCLLQDDSMISKATVETDVLLQPVSVPESVNDARVIVLIKIKPAILTAQNVVFA
ncbi:hypothetical protein [Bradyrhizobium sp. 188]|uniref:hypothetical protein n=1 Tax=Bradyrhizobium sp. 188 TaxID=2782656 RepID=UPI001FFA0414|nr:hypothetical protein [Bradyrhizobium sp. 188]MCK1503117.1 hypothetical protein [Bradyrhizobium sp. 188]